MIKKRLPCILSCLALIAVMTGCGMRTAGFSEPSTPWSEAFVCHTDHYTVHTDTSLETAARIGAFMEKALTEYRALTGFEDAPSSRFVVNAYAARDRYEDIVRSLGLSENSTAGLYTPVPPAAIHLPCLRVSGVYPSATLLHEGTHQFIDQVISFRPPPCNYNIDPTQQNRLMSVPVWLNEGLATYMEGAVTAEDSIETGRINRNRLVHLKKLIRSGTCPSLKEVLERRYGEPFTAEDYAVAWGIVYSLRHAPGVEDQENRRTHLARYLASCRRAFYADPDAEFTRDFLSGGKPQEDLRKRFAVHIARRSREVFEEIVVGKDSTLYAWEEDWKARILKIEP